MESQPKNPEFRNNPENFIHETIKLMLYSTSADPESFVRGGPTLMFWCVFLDDEGTKGSK